MNEETAGSCSKCLCSILVFWFSCIHLNQSSRLVVSSQHCLQKLEIEGAPVLFIMLISFDCFTCFHQPTGMFCNFSNEEMLLTTWKWPPKAEKGDSGCCWHNLKMPQQHVSQSRKRLHAFFSADWLAGVDKSLCKSNPATSQPDILQKDFWRKMIMFQETKLV